MKQLETTDVFYRFRQANQSHIGDLHTFPQCVVLTFLRLIKTKQYMREMHLEWMGNTAL